MDPRSTSPGSNMPSYDWLARGHVDTVLGARKLSLMRKLGVPYTDADVAAAETAQREQAATIVADLATNGVDVEWNSEMVALISYLQRLGREKGIAPTSSAAAAAAPAATTPPEGQ
jgi:cytochrome c oxidase cbb3-type subunit I/II